MLGAVSSVLDSAPMATDILRLEIDSSIILRAKSTPQDLNYKYSVGNAAGKALVFHFPSDDT